MDKRKEKIISISEIESALQKTKKFKSFKRITKERKGIPEDEFSVEFRDTSEFPNYLNYDVCQDMVDELNLVLNLDSEKGKMYCSTISWDWDNGFNINVKPTSNIKIIRK